MERLSPVDYDGGLWDFYELAGAPLYLAPTSKPRFRLSWEGNGYEGEVSAGAKVADFYSDVDMLLPQGFPARP